MGETFHKFWNSEKKEEKGLTKRGECDIIIMRTKERGAKSSTVETPVWRNWQTPGT